MHTCPESCTLGQSFLGKRLSIWYTVPEYCKWWLYLSDEMAVGTLHLPLVQKGDRWLHRPLMASICSKLRVAPFQDGFPASRRVQIPLSSNRSVASSKNASCSGSTTIPR